MKKRQLNQSATQSLFSQELVEFETDSNVPSHKRIPLSSLITPADSQDKENRGKLH